MKVTYNWLKDFVELKVKPEDLAKKLTMSGLEVVSLTSKSGDFVFEIEITSNRPDWLSVVGIAREAAAATGARLKCPQHKSANRKKRAQGLTLKVAEPRDCPLYTAKILRGAKVGPSPVWLKQRLELVGCRSINNVVDATNYVLFESGQPLHAFDLDKLSSPDIIVRRAHKGEEIVTIDGCARTLGHNILVISDKEKAQAVAGVMGGAGSQVTEGTRNLLLEAAVFDPVLIRLTRQALGVQTESAYRFERGIDACALDMASCRAADLICEISGAKLITQAARGRLRDKKSRVALSAWRMRQTLGADIGAGEVKRILTALGFEFKRGAKGGWSARAPSWRRDVREEADLIEELARISGYDRIPATLPRISPRVYVNRERDLVKLTKDALVGLGLNEVITYSLVESAPAAVEIRNPLSREQAVLRTTLMPSLTRCVAYNLNQRQSAVNIFEIAPVFHGVAGGVEEDLSLGVALCGVRSWISGQGLITEEQGFLHIKGIIEALLARLGIKDCAFASGSGSGQAAIIVAGREVGRMQMLEPAISDTLDIKNKEVVTAEISLREVFLRADTERRFFPLSRYPSVVRDISFIIKEEVGVWELITALRKAGGALLSEVRVADCYKGRQIPAGFKGLTLSCSYLSEERTLTEAEISPLHAAMSEVLTRCFGAKLR